MEIRRIVSRFSMISALFCMIVLPVEKVSAEERLGQIYITRDENDVINCQFMFNVADPLRERKDSLLNNIGTFNRLFADAQDKTIDFESEDLLHLPLVNLLLEKNDITEMLEIALNSGYPVVIKGDYTVSRKLNITRDCYIIGRDCTLTASASMESMIESNSLIKVTGDIEFDGNSNITYALISNTDSHLPQIENVVFRNCKLVYRNVDSSTTKTSYRGWFKGCKFYNCASGIKCYGRNNTLVAYNDLVIEDNYWNDECGAPWWVGYMNSVQYINNIAYADATVETMDGTCGYVVESVLVEGNKLNGQQRGLVIGKLVKNVRIVNNDVNVVTNAISLDARVGHVYDSDILNYIGEWDATTNLATAYPNPSYTAPIFDSDGEVSKKGKADFVRVSKEGEWNGWHYRVGDMVIYSTLEDEQVRGSGWFLDYPDVNAVVENNLLLAEKDRAVYIQGSGIELKNNRIILDTDSQQPIRVNGGCRITIADNEIYFKTKETDRSYIYAARYAIVTIGENRLSNLSGYQGMLSGQYRADETSQIIFLK